MSATGVTEASGSDDGPNWRHYRRGKFFVAAPVSREFSLPVDVSLSALSSLEKIQHPHNFLDLLQSLPMGNAVDGIYLFEPLTHKPLRFGPAAIRSDSCQRLIYLEVLAKDNFSLLFHEIGHLVLDTTDDTEKMFAGAMSLEADMEDAPAGAVKSTAENWAHYFAQGLLSANGAEFERFCHTCPLRAMILAHCLLEGWSQVSAAGWVQELRARLEFISSAIAPIGQLILITAVYAGETAALRAQAMVLLLRYGDETQMSMLSAAVQHVNLAGSPLTASEILKVRAFTGLESLDLAGSAVNDQIVCELQGLKNLKKLSLANCRVTSSCLTGLLRLPIVELDLCQTDLNDDAVKFLVQMAQLQHLKLSATALSAEAIRSIGSSLRKCQIELAS